MSAEVPIDYKVTTDGVEEAASNFGDVANSLDQVSNSSASTTSSLDDVASSFGTTTDQIKDTRSELRLQNAAVNDNWNSWKIGHSTLAESQKAFQSISTIGHEVTSMISTLTSAQTNLNTANANVISTENKVTTAQEDYNTAVAKYGPNSSQALSAQKALTSAIDEHNKAVDAASAAQSKYQMALVGVALQIPNVAFNVLNLVMGLQGIGVASSIAGAAHAVMSGIYVAGTTLMTAAQAAFDAVMDANPVVLIILAIIAVAALLYEAWTNDWGGIREKFQAVVDFLKPYIMPVIDAIQVAVKAFGVVINLVWQGIQEYAKIVWTMISLYFQVWWDAAQIIIDALEIAWDALWAGIQAVVKPVMAVVTLVFSTGMSVLQTIIGDLSTAWNDFWGGVHTVVSAAWGLIKPIFDTIWSVLKPILDGLNTLTNASSTVSNVVGSVTGTISSIGSALGLAEGGIIDQPTLAVVGENGPEAVVPLQGLSSTVPGIAGGRFSGGAPGGTVVNHYSFSFPNYVGSKQELIDTVMEGLKRETQRRTS